MPISSGDSRLYRLIHDSTSPYTVAESEVISLTKEKEKELLVSLSQVFRQIQLWTREVEGASDDEAETVVENHHNLSKIVSDLIFLLSVKSQFVQHLAGNILVAIYKFLAASGSNLDPFFRSLCLCLELAITNVLSLPSPPSVDSLIVALNSRLRNAGWSSLAGTIRVLRNILKHLMQDGDCDEVCADVFLDSVTSLLSSVPWYFMDAIDFRSVDQDETRIVFLGNFIQLSCSLVEQINSMQDCCSLDRHLPLSVISNLVPKLLQWCLEKKGECVKTSISRYFSHKLLVLMIRLSSQNRLSCCNLVSWLQLLHNYFEELLQHPLAALESLQDDSLEGSAFLVSISGEVLHGCLPHLKRRAVYLFLRSALLLINPEEETKKHCSCAVENACFTCASISDLDLCCRKKGLSELYQWLRRHCPVDIAMGYETHMEKCMDFSLSFIQLYMSEDDLLFKVLLQLLNLPICRVQEIDKTSWTSQDAKEYISFHMSIIFNPVLLFHLFLLELHYDHQVLLDYLISKDVGISCAEYLLKCLRVICDSWSLFIKFSVGGEVSDQSSGKRRKVICESSLVQGSLSSNSLAKVVPPLRREFDDDLEFGYKHCGTKRSGYKEARDCLLSLKASVENLHRKNLFLYNPDVLLKRLTRFQELCSKHEDNDNLK